MDEKTREEKELNNEDIEPIPMAIIDEKKQLSIRIPKKVVDALQINPKEDIFLFLFDKKEMHLEGFLADKKTYEREFNGKNR